MTSDTLDLEVSSVAMQTVREAQPDERRRRLMAWALAMTLAGNVLLVLGKGVVARLTGSSALYADAANSASDVVYSCLMALGLWLSLRPPDATHPQGHGRFEALAGLVVAAAMTLAAVEAGRAALIGFLHGGQVVPAGWPTLVLVLSAGVKAGMYGGVHAIARKSHSPTLDAAAKDNLSDVLTSLAAFVGTLFSRVLHPLADPVAGALVALWILRAAAGVWLDNIRYLTGGAAPAELRDKIVAEAQAVRGVLNVHQVLTEHVGPQLIADLHINVDGTLPLAEAHAISDAVRHRVESLPEVDRAYVHVEPCEQSARSMAQGSQSQPPSASGSEGML